MNTIDVKVKEIRPWFAPVYKYDSDAACDCKASLVGYSDNFITIPSMCRMTIPLGFCLDLPEGWKCDIKPRSGLSKDNGVFASLGTIDNGYKGELACTLYNLGHEEINIEDGDRICQLEFMPQYRAVFKLVDTLSSSDRNEAGFGSSGIK